jgi:hypothetical protein
VAQISVREYTRVRHAGLGYGRDRFAAYGHPDDAQRGPTPFDRVNADRNCRNVKEVMAIKLEAAPRYQFVGSITYKNKLERTPGLTLPYFSETPQSRLACSQACIGACS